MKVKMRWITPNAEREIVNIARVSSDPTKSRQPDERLLRYLIRNQHWSPFEMASMCVEINGASRAITRQVLRHRSFHFQEFSQRYQQVGVLERDMIRVEARLQHPTNRQASVKNEDQDIEAWWAIMQRAHVRAAEKLYDQALAKGIAKEQARAVLPEGMTPTRMMMAGTIRDWLHYCQLRRGNGTQPEHVAIAEKVWDILKYHIPTIAAAWTEHQNADV